MNLASILISVLLVVAVFIGVRSLHRNKGKCSGCSGNCNECRKNN